jgi:hypothetical protein
MGREVLALHCPLPCKELVTTEALQEAHSGLFTTASEKTKFGFLQNTFQTPRKNGSVAFLKSLVLRTFYTPMSHLGKEDNSYRKDLLTQVAK